MIEIKNLSSNTTRIVELLKKRGTDFSSDIDTLLSLDHRRKSIQKNSDEKLNKSKQIAKQIGELFSSDIKSPLIQKLKKESSNLKEEIKLLQAELKEIEAQIKEGLLKLPNIPDPSVPEGSKESDNQIIRSLVNEKTYSEKIYSHWDLCEKYKLIDFKNGTKVTGSGFPIYKGKGSKLQRSLISYFLDKNTKNGYEEFLPPFLVNEDSAFGTGQLPDKDSQMYHISKDNLYLIPTSEVPITNIYRDNVLAYNDLPIKCTSYSPCFRREAGSYGKNVRGLNRLHQFEKVEIVEIQEQEKSEQALNNMIKHVESILIELGLSYRLVKLCGGDLGFTSSLTYDFEVFSPGQNKWLEVSSISNFKTYQSNRLKLRYKDTSGKIKLCHTLNGSSLALPRIFSTIIETFQKKNFIEIPKVLQKYTGFSKIDL